MTKNEVATLINNLTIKGKISKVSFDKANALTIATIEAEKGVVLEVLFYEDTANTFNTGYKEGDTITLTAYVLGRPYKRPSIVCKNIVPSDFIEDDITTFFIVCGDILAIKRQCDGLFSITVKSKIKDGSDSINNVCLYAPNAKELPFNEGSRVLFNCSAVGSYIEPTDKSLPIIYELAFVVNAFKQYKQQTYYREKHGRS